MSIKPTAKQYAKIAKALTKAGYTPTTVFDILKSSNFNVTLKDKTYNVYASRVIALMHNDTDSSTALKL